MTGPQGGAMGWWVGRWGPVSVRLDGRLLGVLAGGVGAIAGLLWLSVAIGDYRTAWGDVGQILMGQTPNADAAFVVRELRLPRALLAILIGAALGASGSLIQGAVGNPLAAPEILGINGGGGLAIALGALLHPNLAPEQLPWIALGGSLAAAALTYGLGGGGARSPDRLILVGAAAAAAAQAGIQVSLVFAPPQSLELALTWLAGSLSGADWPLMGAVAPWIGVGLAIAVVQGRPLDLLHLGAEAAQGLGVAVRGQRLQALGVAALLAAAAVAGAGAISFVGLMAPHLAHRLVGPDRGANIPVAAVVGSAIVLLSDLLGRWLFSPLELPCGILTAAIGGPYFLYLLARSRGTPAPGP